MSLGGRFGYDDDGETPNTQIAVFGYEPAPLIFEVRGLPRGGGQEAMDTYRGLKIGLSVQCEHGYFAGGVNGGSIYDHDGKPVKRFASSGGRGHQANFIQAMRSRKQSDLRAPIEVGHTSSSLAHFANISYRLGQNTATDAVKEAVQANALTKESVARLQDHLAANGVGSQVPAVLGPTLSIAPGTERLVSKERYDAGYWANTMLQRQYRKPFVVPDMV